VPLNFYLRCFYGFTLQVVPCAVLLLFPFREKSFVHGRRRSIALFSVISLIFSLCFPFAAWWNRTFTNYENLLDNLYMLLTITGLTVSFFLVVRENYSQKCSVLFIVISYAAVQFFLSNMLMDFLPMARQDLVYNDATIAAFSIVTAVLFPPILLFMLRTMRSYLSNLTSPGFQPEFLFLTVIFVLYLVLNALYTSLWVGIRDEFRLGFGYFIPYSLFLSFLLIITFFSTLRLSVFRTANAEQAKELALMQQNYLHIGENMKQQKQALHDTRQLLRHMAAIAQNGTKEDLQKYIDESLENAAISDRRFCANSCINGILQYYAGLAEKQGIHFSVQANCNKLPFSDADMTILFSNILDNALRSAAESAEADPKTDPEIRFTADTVQDQFAILIENSCLSVSYAKNFHHDNQTEREGWLPAGAFLSTHSGGYGLKRVEMIAEKYNGRAWFSYDPKNHLFGTRVMLSLSEV